MLKLGEKWQIHTNKGYPAQTVPGFQAKKQAGSGLKARGSSSKPKSSGSKTSMDAVVI